VNVKSVTPRTSIRSNTVSAIEGLPASEVLAQSSGSDSRYAHASAAVGTRDGRTAAEAASASRRAIPSSRGERATALSAAIPSAIAPAHAGQETGDGESDAAPIETASAAGAAPPARASSGIAGAPA